MYFRILGPIVSTNMHVHGPVHVKIDARKIFIDATLHQASEE